MDKRILFRLRYYNKIHLDIGGIKYIFKKFQERAGEKDWQTKRNRGIVRVRERERKREKRTNIKRVFYCLRLLTFGIILLR